MSDFLVSLIVLIAVLALCTGIKLGANHVENYAREQCADFGKVKLDNKLYECKKIGN